MPRLILRKVKVSLAEEEPVEAWMGTGVEWFWNGFSQPAMTEKQLDAFIAQQAVYEHGTADHVFFHKKDGYCIAIAPMATGQQIKIEQLRKLPCTTPSGEVLYDMGHNWCWTTQVLETV